MNKNYEKESIEAAVYRRLISHLQKNTQVQNIDLMNFAGFCRNCLSKWMVEVNQITLMERYLKIMTKIVF